MSTESQRQEALRPDQPAPADWRDHVYNAGTCIRGLPFRPSGHLPEIGYSGTIRDYPGPLIAESLPKHATATVAMAFFTKTKVTRQGFLNLLSESQLGVYKKLIDSGKSGTEYLATLAITHYLSIMEGVGWGTIPHRNTEQNAAFQELWKASKTRIDDSIIITANDSEKAARDALIRSIEVNSCITTHDPDHLESWGAAQPLPSRRNILLLL